MNGPVRVFCVSVVVVAAVPVTAHHTDGPVSFSRQIRGIFSDRCFKCHGPDEAQRQAGLRLDEQAAALAELDSGTRAIVPGDIDTSEVIVRLTSNDPDVKMPPADSGKTVSAEEIDLLKRWIEQGAEWRRHWAFEPVVRPVIPEHDSQLHPIDYFIRNRLEREGLTPSPEADPVALMRRVSLDLTGLPPTPEEVDSFLSDTSAGAYERLVDRLLASPRCGEHMARYWLDIARYGDTHGLHLDNYREMWAYRDWVVDALIRNKPWDVFITEQLAGDLLPEPTQDQLIATGFNRCNVTTSEGGSIAEEVHVRNVVDRTVTTGTAFLALTLDCSRCHDHKFDPLTMKDFYSLYAYFNSIDGTPLDGNKKDHGPVISLHTDEQAQRLSVLKKGKSTAEAERAVFLEKTPFTEPAKPKERLHAEHREFVWIEDSIPARSETGGQLWKFSGEKWEPVFSGSASTRLDTLHFQESRFLGAPAPLRVGEDDVLFCYAYVDPQSPPPALMLQFHSDDWEHRAFWGADIIGRGKPSTPSRFHVGDLPKSGEWVRLEVRAADVGLQPGDIIDGWSVGQHNGGVWWDRGGIVSRIEQSPWHDSLNVWQKDISTAADGLPVDVRHAVTKPAEQRSEDEFKVLKDYFLNYVWSSIESYRVRVDTIDQAIAEIENSVPTTLVFRETTEPKPAHMLRRGEYDRKGEEVDRGVPAALPGLPEGAPPNRLGLAQWLTSPNHPLTSRVAVNRFWQQFFGTGLVKTSEDFGSQGEPPSHPKLLDWLSAEFMDPQMLGAVDRWDSKHLIRQIVKSAAYRQSAAVSPELLQKDPENRLLARGPRFRLDAETLRDQALFTSGLLYEQLGGPSVKPPQPEGLWQVVGFVGSNTAVFRPDHGHDLVHRRSLYTFIKRTSPPPQMSTFDGPSRENCVVRRERSNSPMQALLMMNDPQYVECARALAERTLQETDNSDVARAVFLLRQCVLRQPTPEEVKGLVDDYRAFRDDYEANSQAARALIRVGEPEPSDDVDPADLAAWTMVANLVLNLDEVMNK